MKSQTKWIAAVMVGLLAVATTALAASTDCYAFFGYGQSTLDAPACVITYFDGYFDGQTLTVTKFLAGGSGDLKVGVPLSGPGVMNVPTTVITAFGTGKGREGSYTVNNPQTLGSTTTPVTCSALIAIEDFTALTPTNVTRNAYMIADPLGGPRPMWESLTPTNGGSEFPVSTAAWKGFTPLHELAFAFKHWRGFLVGTPMSGFAAQFAAEKGEGPDRYAMVLANLSRGGADWATSTLQLKPGTAHWTNLLTAAKYIKSGVQDSPNALVNNPGPLKYRTGGMIMRLGETAAAGGIAYAATAFTTSSTNIFMGGTAPATLGTGWQVYDGTKFAWVGTVQSWTGTNLVLQGTAATKSVGANDQLRFSIGQDGFLGELREMVELWNKVDIAEPRNALGTPIFAAHPSSANFTVCEATYGFHIALAHVREALADRRFVLAGPSFMGRYQSDAVHQQADGNALVGAYIGQWAAWWYQGKRTVPFIMTAASVLKPTQCDGTHYGIRVTFAIPPTGSAAQQTLQFYTDSMIPKFSNYGFAYTDGVIVFDHAGASASGIKIAASPFLATTNTNLPGAANQIDIPLSGDPSAATHPTISLGASITPNGVAVNGCNNIHIFAHNVADSSTHAVALPGLSGRAFGAGGNQLVNFASACAIEVGQTLVPAW